MTAKQERLVEILRREILEHDGLHDAGRGKYEYKQFEVTDHGSFVSVLSEVGMIGDEGTMASVFCRTRRHIFIGRRGGMQLVNTKGEGGKRARGMRVTWALTS